MQITGISLEQFRTIIRNLNADKYAINPIIIETATELSDNRFRVKIGMTYSRVAGSRTSWSGRHGKYASWHTFFWIMESVFHLNESARIQAGRTVYRGYTDFMKQTDHNLYENIGSMVSFVTWEDVAVDLDWDEQRPACVPAF